MSTRSNKPSVRLPGKYGIIIGAAAVLLSAVASIPFFGGGDRYDGATAEARYFDVGQGDAAMFLWDGGAILIDAGTNESQRDLVDEIEALGIDEIDCAVFTHPHEDHIGGADYVLESFDVNAVIMPDTEAESNSYYSMMECVREERCPVYDAEAGGEYTFGDVTLSVLSPAKEFGEANLDSAVVMIEYGDVSFLFMGDCETEAELAALDKMGDDAFDCDVIKIGHHGSYTSTSEELLSAATPDIAVISCGKGNDYGHPHRETLEKLEEHGIALYRTDRLGTVTVKTDGKTVWVGN